MKALLRKIRQILRDRKTRRIFTRFVSTVAAIVVFVTTYALVLPAITMEAEAQCGLEAHQHSDECFEEVLVCDLPESQGHSHDESCYAVSSALVCEIEEHEHSEESGCYDENGDLICEVPEHIHSEESGCFEEIRELICGISESEGHQHDSSCYEKVLTCGKEAHTHSTACYTSSSTGAAGSMEAAAVASTASAAAASTESAAAADTENEAAGAAEESVDDTSTDPAGANMSAEGDTAPTGTTGTVADSNGYVPVLDALDFYTLLNKNTGIYYSRPADFADANGISAADDTIETDDGNGADASNAAAENPAEAAWNRIDKDTTLTESDTFRLYLAYTIPAGSLNSTNPTTRYRLPENITLTDEQAETINGTANGIASQYINLDTLEILDYEKYQETLGLEAVEGTRTPSDDLNEYLARNDGQEFISATVKVENVFDEVTGEYLGQDLVFTFTPYSILKNRHEYDEDGQPTKAGEELRGWVSLDVTTEQIGWTSAGDGDDAGETEGSVEKTADIVFVEKDRELGIDKISTELKLVEKTSAEEARADKAEDADAADTADSDTDEAAEENKEETGDVDSRDEEKEAEEETAAPPAVSYPSITFDDSITVSAGSLSTDTESITGDSGLAAKTEITVHVEADEDTFPEGTTMRLAAVTDDQMDAVTEAVEGAMAEAADAQGTSSRTQGFHAVDISFLNADGIEIEPLKPIRVSMTSEAIKRAVEDESTAPVVVHVDDCHNAAADNFAGEGVTADGSAIGSDDGSANGDSAVDGSLVDPAKENQNAASSSAPETGTEAVTDAQALPTASIIDTAAGDTKSENTDTLTFEAGAFSVYAIVYTVDFHWEVNGKIYDFSIPGGGFVSFYKLVEALGIEVNDTTTEKDEIQELVDGVESIEISDPDLVSVSKVEEDTTVGAIKDGIGLECEYSAELTEEEIAEINALEVKAGDWALIALRPFDTEESLTVTMKNGDQWTVKVTDAQEIDNAEAASIDVNKSYLICYEMNGQYYLLKNDGSVDNTHTPATFENLNSSDCWTFNYVFEEKHLEDTLTYVYYLIRPIDNKTKTIALNAEGEPLVQRSNNNVAVVPVEGGGFKLIGYNNIRLNFDNGQFLATEFPDDEASDGITVHIWEMDSLPSYSYKVYSADEIRGSVEISGGTPKTENVLNDEEEVIQVIHYYEAESNSDKLNAGTIRAIPDNHPDGDGDNKWLFDHWEQDGLPLDRDQYPRTISAETLPIPFNGSKLVAYFKQNPRYDVPPGEKEPSKFENLQDWIDSLQTNPVPLDNEQTVKTSEVYDYENRIYRVDIASKSNFRTFNGNVDMAFCLDVSNSMYFPSALAETTTSNYDHGNVNIPIYQINNGGWGWSNQGWLDTNRGYSNPYFLVADQANTATVFKIYYKSGEWRAIDASRANDSDSTKWFKIGNDFRTTWTATQYDDGTNKNHPFNLGDSDSTTYTIYDWAPDDQGTKRNRFYYLNQGLSSATSDLTTIKDILAVAGDESPKVRVAYNTFNLNLGSQRQDFEVVTPITGIDLSNSAGGGTRPDQAFIDAQDFKWQGDDRYVILITDGAPQGKREGESDNDFNRISKEVKDQADILKEYGNVKFITIGLSLDKVPHGKQLLYDLADNDKNGDKMFFLAEDAGDLPNILRQIVHTIMDESIVIADVTDTIGEAFYAVDKISGMPLVDGDMIDSEGCLTTDSNNAVGIIEVADGVTTIKWTNQAVDSQIGWHGAVFVKAKEELLGGNALKTNGEAKIEAKKYRMGTKEYTFDDSLIEDKLKSLNINFNSPRVNVNELTFPNSDSEWTVYKGTEVDPNTQLKKMYEDILVEQVVNEDGSLHYPLAPNNISDNRESQAAGDADTFHLADVILECLKATAGTDNDLAALYVQGDELNWNAFLEAVCSPEGLKVPYHMFGTEGEDSAITVKLTKQILTGEEGDLVGHSPHDTTVVNDGEIPAEKYTLTIRYDPDYDHVLPAGQGGKPNGNHNYNFSTGIYGSMYQGHASGREESIIGHKINVYEAPLDVYKTDENNDPLAGATFKLYTEDAENGTVIDGLDSTKKYTEAASATSGNNGIARLKQNGEDFGLVPGKTYYLIEASAPANYTKVNTIWEVEVQTEVGKFTDLSGKAVYSTINPDPDAAPPVTAGTGVTDDMYPFNWEQGARIVLDGKDPVPVIAKGEAENTTIQITDGSFISHEKAVSFRHTVQNLGGKNRITVNKEWEGVDNPPDSITVKLYRVSEKDHVWGNGKVVPCTCTSKGNKEYTCSVCGETETYVLDEAGHKAGTLHRENETIPTCTDNGGYDMVVRCTVCNAVISSEHVDITAPGHTWVNQETATTDRNLYCYDTVDVCSVCGEINETSRVHHDHDWGEWEVITPAGINVAGKKTHICQHDSTHVQSETIDPLPARVTIRFEYLRGGCGGGWTYIATRTATGLGDMTIQWNWDQYTSPPTFGVEGLGTSTYTTSSSSNNKGAQQTLTISNITTNLTLRVRIRNSGYAGTADNLIGQPTFSGIPNRSLSTNSIRRLSSTAKRSATAKLMASNPPRNGAGVSVMADEALKTYLNALKTKGEASCKENEEHVYKEYVGDFLIFGDSWTLNIPDLPKYNEYGKEYNYYIVEHPALEGYEITYTGQDDGLHNEGEVTIHNKLTKGSLTITKNVSVPAGLNISLANGTYTFEIWNEDGTAQITKNADGTDIGILQITVTDGVASPAELTVDNLTAGFYLVKETASTNSATVPDTSVSGYDASLGGVAVEVTAGNTQVPTAAFTNKYETTAATVKKVWEDNNSPDRPSSLTVTLVADGEITEQTVTLSESNHWEDTISNLQKYKDGVEIDYYWLEGEMPDGYFLTNVTKAGTITTLTNKRSQYDLKTSYTGIKTWSDADNKYSTRPHELTVTLYADGVAQTLDPVWKYDYATNQWSYTFENLPVFTEAGTIVSYTAQETVPYGYQKTDESQTATSGQLGTITYENGTNRITSDNKVVWTLGSLIDLSFVAIKPTANGDVVVWTHRIPVPSERTAIINAIKGGALPGCAGRNIVFYSGTGDVETPHGNVGVTYDQANLSVTLDFGATSVWSQFIVGQFNKNNSSSYDAGTTSFTNTLETTVLEGTKKWNIEGDEIPEDPILTLTRTVMITEGEGSNAVTVTSAPEVVKVMQGGTLVNLQPEWSGDGKTRAFSYTGLLKYDSQGNEYTYSVAEASFTVGSGENAVTYTAVKAADGSYTVTADKPEATVFTVTQTGNDITNGLIEATIEIVKVEKGHKDSSHTLSGAKFQLTRVNEDNDNNYSGEGAFQSEIQTVDTETGKTTFSGLRPGRYKLEEKEAPAGYVLVESPWYFTIDGTGSASLQAGCSYELASAVVGKDNAFWIENNPGAALPSSGGIGTRIFHTWGLLLMVGSALMLISNKPFSKGGFKN